jgi:ubiquitin-protein ligase
MEEKFSCAGSQGNLSSPVFSFLLSFAMAGAVKRLTQELKVMTTSPPDGITASPIDSNNLTAWRACIRGPVGTPYEGAYIHLRIDFPVDYPFSPPKVKILTQIAHINVLNGNPCIDILITAGEQVCCWSPCYKISHVLLSISALLNLPNPDHAFRPELAALYRRDRAAHDAHVREFTLKHAMDPNPPASLMTPWSTAPLPGAEAIAEAQKAITGANEAAAAAAKKPKA